MNSRQQSEHFNINETRILKFLVLFVLVINSIALFFPILRNDDPVLYANIAKNMALSNDWFRLMFDNKPWLDKPHFPFWITSVSFKIFGINSFAYILPGFLFNLLGAIYTYKLSRYLYDNETIALIALLIYMSAIHLLLSNSLDLRAEAYLLGEITPAIYYWLRYSNIYLCSKVDSEMCSNGNWYFLKNLFLGAIFTALAMMTKGIFTLITIFSGVIYLAFYTNKWRELFKLKWLLALILSFIFIAPEIISLYIQFDLHPNLVVFNHTGVSGVQWFFWGSQFGRFFNTGQIAVNHTQPFHYLFFIHTFLWAFLPWSLLFCYAIFLNFKQNKNSNDRQSFIFLCACFLPTFILFSLTKFQLDHYTNILMPFAAIVTAHTLYNSVGARAARIFFKIQLMISIVLLTASSVLWYLVFHNSYLYFVFIALILWSWVLNRKNSAEFRIVFYSVTSICAVFVTITYTLGKFDSRYDAGYNIALELNNEAVHLPVVAYGDANWVTFRFYYLGSYTQVQNLKAIADIKTPYYLVFNATNVEQISELKLENTLYVTTIKGNTIDKVLPYLLNRTKLKNNLINYEVLKVN